MTGDKARVKEQRTAKASGCLLPGEGGVSLGWTLRFQNLTFSSVCVCAHAALVLDFFLSYWFCVTLVWGEKHKVGWWCGLDEVGPHRLRYFHAHPELVSCLEGSGSVAPRFQICFYGSGCGSQLLLQRLLYAAMLPTMMTVE